MAGAGALIMAADLRGALGRRAGTDWLEDVRLEAAELSGFPALPSRDSESWRKINLSGLDLSDPSLALRAAPMPVSPVLCPSGVLHTVTSAHDTEESVRTDVREITRQRLASPRGHIFERLAVALSGATTIVQAVQPSTDPVTLVRSADAVSGNKPAGIYGHVAILVERGADLTIVEELRGGPDGGVPLWCTATDIRVADGGRINYVLLRDFGGREYAFHDVRITLGRDSRAHVSIVNRGGLVGKTILTGILAEPGAALRGIGIATGRNREFHDMEMRAEHLAEHTESSLLYKTVLNDRAHSVFNGNLHIAPGLKHAQSRQINNNVLLGSKARAESMPNLVVRAEDVSAEHGATVGQLDREVLFFLMSRGLPEPDARHLLIEGFIQEIVSEIPLASRREEILLAVKNNLSL